MAPAAPAVIRIVVVVVVVVVKKKRKQKKVQREVKITSLVAGLSKYKNAYKKRTNAFAGL
jgi:sensor domain CHASE-containing protein